MAYDKARCERLCRAMVSDTVVYLKDTIFKGLEEDSFYELLSDNFDHNRKELEARYGAEVAKTNMLERTIVDEIIVPLGAQQKFPIF